MEHFSTQDSGEDESTTKDLILVVNLPDGKVLVIDQGESNCTKGQC